MSSTKSNKDLPEKQGLSQEEWDEISQTSEDAEELKNSLDGLKNSLDDLLDSKEQALSMVNNIAGIAGAIPSIITAVLILLGVGGISLTIYAFWPDPIPEEMNISELQAIKEFKVLKLCLEDIVTQTYKDRTFSFVVRGDAVYGVDFDKITWTEKEEGENQKTYTVQVPLPHLLNSRINYDNEERQGLGIEKWKYDNSDLPDEIHLRLENERGQKGEEAIRNLALKADFQKIAKKQTMQLLESLFKGAKQKVIFQWQKENSES